jgi:cell wall-associated NlpC family hydrolase
VLLAALVGGATVTAALAPAAGAAPVDDKREQATALEAEIAANADQLADLYEQIKFVEDNLALANQTIADAQSRIETARAETRRLQRLVRKRAASVYRSSTKGETTSLFEIDIREASSREKYAAAASEKDDDLLEQLDAARDELRTRQRDAQTAKETAETEKARLDAIRADFETGQAERERLLGQVQGEIASLVAAASQQRATKEAGANFDPASIPPASGRGGVAVGYAQAQLGKPYCYAGIGPSCFDCSGLTQQAWSAAGVGLPHNSEAQYGSFPRVPMNQLSAGDVVWYPGHVGIYAGGGSVIHASSSGNAVRYQSVSYYQGAVRPG